MARCHAEQDKRQCCHGCDDVYTDLLDCEQPKGADSHLVLVCS